MQIEEKTLEEKTLEEKTLEEKTLEEETLEEETLEEETPEEETPEEETPEEETPEEETPEEETPIAGNVPAIPSVPENCELKFRREMLILGQGISTLVNKQEGKVIQFIGSQQGEGTSTIAREFARISAELGSQSVLLLDADSHQLAQHQNLGIKPKTSLEHVMTQGGNLDEAFTQVGQSNFFLGALFAEIPTSLSNGLFSNAEEAWRKLRQRFDLILIDCPPVTTSVEGIALSAMVDGVVLVIEADRTRSPIIKKTKERIMKGGGNVLGIVFNKQRYYIPEWLYKRL